MIEESEDTETSLDRTKGLGTLRVVFQRVLRKKRLKPHRQKGEMPNEISEISEESLKGTGLANSVR